MRRVLRHTAPPGKFSVPSPHCGFEPASYVSREIFAPISSRIWAYLPSARAKVLMKKLVATFEG